MRQKVLNNVFTCITRFRVSRFYLLLFIRWSVHHMLVHNYYNTKTHYCKTELTRWHIGFSKDDGETSQSERKLLVSLTSGLTDRDRIHCHTLCCYSAQVGEKEFDKSHGFYYGVMLQKPWINLLFLKQYNSLFQQLIDLWLARQNDPVKLRLGRCMYYDTQTAPNARQLQETSILLYTNF